LILKVKVIWRHDQVESQTCNFKTETTRNVAFEGKIDKPS